jgi:hypothetical protein
MGGVKEKLYEIWYKTREHHRHETESLSGTKSQLLNRLTEMGALNTASVNFLIKPWMYELEEGEKHDAITDRAESR